jgi:hypothetical protein
MIGAPTTGLVRMEWVMARFGQVIPCNWSMTVALQGINQFSPIGYQVANARNLIVDSFLKEDYEWLFFIDHDVILPSDTFLKINEIMIHRTVPIWAGIYFTKSVPSEPLIYRGRGTGYYPDWKFGDIVWVDGIHMGCTLIHRDILVALAEVKNTYQADAQRGPIKEVYKTPGYTGFNPEKLAAIVETGTEDLHFCRDLQEHKILEKTGWDKEVPDLQYPVMVDTSVFCRHIDHAGVQYPSMGEEEQFMSASKSDGLSTEE